MQSIPWKQASRHQTNLSPTKATYAFPRDPRFKATKNNQCESFYNIPSSLGKAPAPGIGKGNKTQLINPNIMTPSPQNYHIHSSLEKKNKGIQFGLGRQKIKYNGIFQKSQTPEPGHYEVLRKTSTKKGFTLYSKIQLPRFSNYKNPGPGQYQSVASFNSSGKYVLSNLSNCPGYKIKPVKEFLNLNTNPGPGQYRTQQENLNSTGRYSISKHENSRCRTFSKSAKGVTTKREIPGPGAYNYISQFGKRI